MDLNEINTNTKDGRLLLAAVAIISTTVSTDKTPHQILDDIKVLSDYMYNGQDYVAICPKIIT